AWLRAIGRLSVARGVGNVRLCAIRFGSWGVDRQGYSARFGAAASTAATVAEGRAHVLDHVLAMALGFCFVEVGAQVGKEAMEAGAARLAFGRTVEQE